MWCRAIDHGQDAAARPAARKLAFLSLALDLGGGERVISELSRHLPPEIPRTVVLFEDRVSYPHGGDRYVLDLPFPRGLIRKPFYLWKAFRRLKRYLERCRPRWVMSFDLVPNLVNALANPRGAIVRCDLPPSHECVGSTAALKRRLFDLVFRRAAGIVAVSRGVARDVQEHFRVPADKIQVIYNPVDLAAVDAASKASLDTALEALFERPVIATMGRLSQQKGQWHLVRAMAEVRRSVPDAQLVVLGAGELAPYLRELAAALGIAEAVHLLGWQPNPFRYVGRARVFALPSLWEGFGIAIVEAMRCGVPVIAADCPHGPREILAPDGWADAPAGEVEVTECGVLVPVCDGVRRGAGDSLTPEEQALAKAIVLLLNDQPLRESLAAAALARAEAFDADRIAAQYADLFSHSMPRRRAPHSPASVPGPV